MGSLESRRELPEFDLAVLGYDRRQVKRCLRDLTARLDEALRQLDANLVLRQQLAEARRELEYLRRKPPAPPIGADDPGWSERIGRILAAAEEEAIAMRAEAERDAEQIRARALAESLQARRDLEAALRARQASAERLEALLFGDSGGDPQDGRPTERRTGDLARS